MKKLSDKFKTSGFTLELIKRVDFFAIYGRFKEDFKKETYHFEVIRIRSHNGYFMKGKEIAASEFYPSTSSWGVDGFTFKSLKEAENKLEQLINNKDARKI